MIWKELPSAPLILSSAPSDINKGATTQNPPPLKPLRNLPIMNIVAFLANAISIHPKMNGTARIIIVYFRPIMSIIIPTQMAAVRAASWKLVIFRSV